MLTTCISIELILVCSFPDDLSIYRFDFSHAMTSPIADRPEESGGDTRKREREAETDSQTQEHYKMPRYSLRGLGSARGWVWGLRHGALMCRGLHPSGLTQLRLLCEQGARSGEQRRRSSGAERRCSGASNKWSEAGLR